MYGVPTVMYRQVRMILNRARNVVSSSGTFSSTIVVDTVAANGTVHVVTGTTDGVTVDAVDKGGGEK